MPTGIYKRNKNMKTGKHMLGKHLSDETKQKISIKLKGINTWSKGKKLSFNTKMKIKKNNSKYWLGKKIKEETKEKMILSRKGITSSKKGKHYKSHSGENHWNWKGGKTLINKLERIKFRTELQKLVFIRDNYTCVLCGNNKDLQVDHIQSWADYIELRFSIDNCRTLCMSCHYKVTFKKDMPKNIKKWGHNLKHKVKGGDSYSTYSK